MDDTSPAGHRRYRELLAGQTPAQRLAIAVSLSRAVRELALAGVRAAHPRASESEIAALLAERLYGATIANRLYGAPRDEG